MHIAPATLLILTSALSALAVPSATHTPRGLTNAQRLARGLHLNTPKRLYYPHKVLRSVPSPVPEPLSCPSGQYFNGEACLICPENTFSLDGATECTPCPDGHMSPPGSSECQEPPPTTCDPGFYIKSRECVECPADTYSPGGAADGCTGCPFLWTSPPGASECVPPEPTICPPGSEPVLDECSQCTAGTYSSTGESCISCPVGQTSEPGAESCSPIICPAGQYYDLPNGGCVLCPANTYSPAGASECIACGQFENSSPGSSSCDLTKYVVALYEESGARRGYLNTIGTIAYTRERAAMATIVPAESSLHAIGFADTDLFVSTWGPADLSNATSNIDTKWHYTSSRSVLPVILSDSGKYFATDIFDVNVESRLITPIFQNLPVTLGTTPLEVYEYSLVLYAHKSFEQRKATLPGARRLFIKLEDA